MKAHGITLCLAIASVASASPQITSSIPSYRTNTKENMSDGNRDTYFWSSRKIRKDETISLYSKKPWTKGKTIIVRDGKPDGKDKFHGAVLEGSIDGKTWVKLAERRADIICATLTRPLNHLRLRASHNTNHWIAIREVQVANQSPLKIYKKTINYKGRSTPLTLTVNLEGFAELKPKVDTISKVYFSAWPKLAKMLDAPVNTTHHNVNLSFNSEISHPAHASGNNITISSKHLINNPEDTRGVFIHELTHVIQRHRGPGWFIEGVADYTRFKLNPNDKWAQWCRKRINYDKPFGYYWSSAAFLLYLEDTYSKPIVRTITTAMRANTYEESMWKKLTGKTLVELAADYKKSGWKPKK